MGLFHWIHRRKMAAYRGIPGPKPVYPFGTALRFVLPVWTGKKTVWELCAEYGRDYGGLSMIWIGSMPVLVLNDRDLIREVLVTDPTNFYKLIPVAALIPVVTKHNPFVDNHEVWARNRAADPFSQGWFSQWLDGRIEPVRAFVASRCDDLVAGGEVPLYGAIERLTFEAFSVAVLGERLPEGRYRDFLRVAKTGSFRITTSLPVLPPPLNPFFYRARRRWRACFEELVAEAVADPEPNADDLINRTLTEGTSLTHHQLANAMGNIYFGGTFSAASAIATNLYLLAGDDSARAVVGEELSGKVGPGFDRTALDSLDQIRWSLLESMRLLPPVPFYSRTSRAGIEVPLGDRQLPPETRLFISNYLLQRGDYWTDGETYRPSRWANGFETAHPIGSGFFFPFGRGARACMGRDFAMTIVQTVLATLWSRLEVETRGPYEQSFFFGVMIPKKSLRARFSRK